MNIGAHIAFKAYRDVADAEFSRPSDGSAGRQRIEVIDRRERKSGLLRHGSKATKKARKPKAYAVFVGMRDIRGNGADEQRCDREFTVRSSFARWK
ncbi:hypothetical protein [Methylovirgula ligni]|uniref:hypothetical protein n=1 Tax=Methylovirgula ligni TaxID=569860 RepID=UPI00315D22E4